MGGSRVLIVFGGGSVVRSGLLKRVEDTLVAEGIVYEEFGGVHPNPLMSFAQKGVEEAISFDADLILAVGGGSAIDTAKAIGPRSGKPGGDAGRNLGWKDCTEEILAGRCGSDTSGSRKRNE